MIRLFLRNYVLFIIIILAVAGAAWWFATATSNFRDNENAQVVTQGSFSFLAQQIKNKPESEWAAIVKSFQPKYGNELVVVSFDKLPKKLQNSNSLKEGNVVASYTLSSNKPDFAYDYAFKRIENSSYYFRYKLYHADAYFTRAQVAWFAKVIDYSLSQRPEKAWGEVLEHLSLLMGAKLSLVNWSSLTANQQKIMTQWQNVYSDHYFGHIETYLLPSPSSNWVVKMVIQDSFFTRNAIFFAAGFVLVVLLLIIWFWTFPFYHALQRLLKQAEEYSKGNFVYQTTVPKRLALYPLYENLSKMGERIGDLIQSHKELTGAVSHEIRTPLACMRFATEMLADANNADRVKYIDQINESIHELDVLVDELLTYSRFDRKGFEVKRVNVNVLDFVQGIFKRFAESFTDKYWGFEAQVSTDLSIEFDPEFFHKALSNLLSNGYRYGASKVLLSVFCQDKKIHFVVEDDGPGIPKMDRERIFEPFVRLDESRQRGTGGHGLGLSIVKKIVEAHEGEVQVADSEIGGAKLTIMLLNSGS